MSESDLHKVLVEVQDAVSDLVEEIDRLDVEEQLVARAYISDISSNLRMTAALLRRISEK